MKRSWWSLTTRQGCRVAGRGLPGQPASLPRARCGQSRSLTPVWSGVAEARTPWGGRGAREQAVFPRWRLRGQVCWPAWRRSGPSQRSSDSRAGPRGVRPGEQPSTRPHPSAHPQAALTPGDSPRSDTVATGGRFRHRGGAWRALHPSCFIESGGPLASVVTAGSRRRGDWNAGPPSPQGPGAVGTRHGAAVVLSGGVRRLSLASDGACRPDASRQAEQVCLL